MTAPKTREKEKTAWLRDKLSGNGRAKAREFITNRGFVQTFLTKEAISWKLSDEDKKSAGFVFKIHSRKGSTRLFLPLSKPFLSSFKAAKARISHPNAMRYERW